MLECKIWMYTFMVLQMIQNGKTQCNLKNGQCTYDMKIGQQGQCDSVTSTSMHGSGGHITGSCTCDDVSRLSTKMNTMKNTESNLKQLMIELNQYINNATTELSATDSKLQNENQKSNRLNNTLNTMESQLNQTKDHLNSVLKSATSELTGLRQKLATNTRDLTMCQTALGTPVSTNAGMFFGGYKTRYFVSLPCIFMYVQSIQFLFSIQAIILLLVIIIVILFRLACIQLSIHSKSIN